MSTVVVSRVTGIAAIVSPTVLEDLYPSAGFALCAYPDAESSTVSGVVPDIVSDPSVLPALLLIVPAVNALNVGST